LPQSLVHRDNTALEEAPYIRMSFSGAARREAIDGSRRNALVAGLRHGYQEIATREDGSSGELGRVALFDG
jgi:hypothetical protein